MKKLWLAALVLMAPATQAHRLDEYLQATLVSVDRDRVKLEVNLTPGVAVLPVIQQRIDSDGDGIISSHEERAYSKAVGGDISLALDGLPLMLVLTDSRFDPWSEMKEGRGVIHLRFEAELPHNDKTTHQLHFENRHQPFISSYLVNSLVPSDKFIHIASQERDYFQTSFRLAYSQSNGMAAQPRSHRREWLAGIGILVLAGLFCRNRFSRFFHLHATTQTAVSLAILRL